MKTIVIQSRSVAAWGLVCVRRGRKEKLQRGMGKLLSAIDAHCLCCRAVSRYKLRSKLSKLYTLNKCMYMSIIPQ